MKIILAIDSFKGCLTSAEAEQSAAQGIADVCPDAEVVSVPMADGGEGMLEAFTTAMNGQTTEADVHDPMMRRIKAAYAICGETAIIETAKAIGLTLLKEEERNPLRATSYGAGELMADALRRGCTHLMVGLGGSATSDCGIGMLQALIDAFAPHGHIDEVKAMFPQLRITIACDVDNPLCGFNGAAHVFAPQKGATPEMVETLERRAEKFAELSQKHCGFDRSGEKGAGAAGGLGYAFLQYFDAKMKSGADALLQLTGFDEIIAGADHIVTGEGSADRQTLMGKLPSQILRYGQRHHIPVFLIAGMVKDRDMLLQAGFHDVRCINPPSLSHEEAIQPEAARQNIRKTLAYWVSQQKENRG